MKVLAPFVVLAWLMLFFWVGAYEIGMVAALVSFIGFCVTFLIVRHFRISREWGISVAAAAVAPILAGLLLEAWNSVFPAPHCIGDDCVTLTVEIPAES